MRHCGTCHAKDGNEHFFVFFPSSSGQHRTTANNPVADGGMGYVTLRAADLGAFSRLHSGTSR